MTRFLSTAVGLATALLFLAPTTGQTPTRNPGSELPPKTDPLLTPPVPLFPTTTDTPKPAPGAKQSSDGPKSDRESNHKRAEYRPVTDWPHRIDLLIRQSQPAIAFSSIFEAGNELSHQERTELMHRALNELAARAEVSKAPSVSLREIQGAREKAALLGDLAINRTMEAVEARMATEVIYADVHAIKDFMDRGQWGQAANRANVRLLQPNLPADVKTVLSEVARVGRHLQALDQLQAAMRTADRNRPADTADALRRIDLDSLSSALEGHVRRLRGLTELRTAADDPWVRAPSVDAIRRSLADLQETNEELNDRIQQDLAVKMLLEGYSHEAREMLPKNGTKEHAATLLHDLNGVLRGGQELRSPQIRHIASATEWNLPGRPPVGIRPFISPNDRSKWQPPSKSSDSSKPVPLDPLVRQEHALREQLRDILETERQSALDNGAESLARVRAQDSERKRFEDEDQRLFTELESLVQRPLTPADRFVARESRQRGKPASEIVTLLGPHVIVDRPTASQLRTEMDLPMISPDERRVYVTNMVAAGAEIRPAVLLAAELVLIAEVEMSSVQP